MLSKYLFSEWKKEGREKGRKKCMIQIELEKPALACCQPTTVLPSELIARVVFCLLFWGLSDVLEKSHQRRKGHLRKQCQAYRVCHYQRVNKLEICIPCQKHEGKELGNDYFLFSWRSGEMCYRANVGPKYWSAFMPQEPNAVSLRRLPMALALAGRPVTEWCGNSSINTCFL